MKHLFITLKVQDGENTHTHRVLTTCYDHDNILQAADGYVSDYYDKADEKRDGWYYFHGGTIAAKVENVELLTEYEYKLMSKIFSGEARPGYFQIVQTGYEVNLQREEVEINCGENGKIMIHQDEDKLGFIIDVFGQNNEAGTMTIWEEDLIDTDEEDVFDPNNVGSLEIDFFVNQWGQKHNDLCEELGYNKKTSDDIIMLDFFWYSKSKVWIPKNASLYTEYQQAMADYLKSKQ